MIYSIFMTDSPWPIETDRSQPPSYVMNEYERRYCVTGQAQGSYSKSKLKTRIKNKRINELPNRFQDLIDDILLFEYSDNDFLSTQESSELSEEIRSITRRSNKLVDNNDILFDGSVPQYYRTKNIHFGVELGFALRSLFEPEHSTGLLYGLTLGLFGEPVRKIENEYFFLTEYVLPQIEKDISRRPDAAKKHLPTALNDVFEQNCDLLERAFNKNGIDIDVRYIGLEQVASLTLSRPPVAYNRSDIIKQVRRSIDISGITIFGNLYHKLKTDFEILDNKIQKGVEVEDLLNEIHNLSFDDHTKQFLEYNFQRTDIPQTLNQKPAVAALNKMSSSSHSPYIADPILDKTDQHSWSLTDYGKLLCYSIYARSSLMWVYKFKFDPPDLSYYEVDLIKNVLTRPLSIGASDKIQREVTEHYLYRDDASLHPHDDRFVDLS